MRKNKLLLLLALLMTAATGARAAWTGGTYTATATENLGAITVNGDATLTINSDVTVTVTGGINIASGTLTVTGPGTLVVNGAKGNDGNSDFDGGPGGTGGVAISGNIIVQGGATVTATGGTGGTGGNGEWDGGTGGNGGVAFAGTLTYKSGTVTANGGSAGSGGYIDDEERYASSGSAGKAFANDVDFTQTTGYSVTNGTSTIGSVLNQTKVVISGGTEPASASGPEVAWDEDKKTGTFTMPGGNVTLEPEYYPQATVADGGVTAADDDARATTDDPLVKVDATKLTGAKKLMYFVSNSGTTAPAYDAEGWTDQLPTAEGLTQQGIVYVWYYPVGIDEGVDGATATYSDGDICLQSITARIAPEPTYAVTFAEGTDPNEWTADPNAGVTKGKTVTVTYNGSKKVIGVKAEKKSAATYTLLSAATAEDIGKVVCAAGHLHDAKTAVPDGCTAVGILGKVTETGHGLILALQDAAQQEWNTINGWASASYAGTTLKVLPDDAARGNLTSYTALGETTVSNWAVAQKSDYEPIFTNLGSTTDNNGKTCDGNVNAYITTGVGGTAITYGCWSATEYEDNEGWYFYSEYWSQEPKDESNHVRPVLGF